MIVTLYNSVYTCVCVVGEGGSQATTVVQIFNLLWDEWVSQL